jgi:hypothetical protein
LPSGASVKPGKNAPTATYVKKIVKAPASQPAGFELRNAFFA